MLGIHAQETKTLKLPKHETHYRHKRTALNTDIYS